MAIWEGPNDERSATRETTSVLAGRPRWRRQSPVCTHVGRRSLRCVRRWGVGTARDAPARRPQPRRHWSDQRRRFRDGPGDPDRLRSTGASRVAVRGDRCGVLRDCSRPDDRSLLVPSPVDLARSRHRDRGHRGPHGRSGLSAPGTVVARSGSLHRSPSRLRRTAARPRRTRSRTLEPAQRARRGRARPVGTPAPGDPCVGGRFHSVPLAAPLRHWSRAPRQRLARLDAAGRPGGPVRGSSHRPAQRSCRPQLWTPRPRSASGDSPCQRDDAAPGRRSRR